MSHYFWQYHVSLDSIIPLCLLSDSLNLLQKPVEGPAGAKQDPRSFKLIFEYIKALPVSTFTPCVLFRVFS